MSNRYDGVVALERFLVVVAYRESHQLASSSHPLRTSGADRAAGNAGKPASGTAANPRR
jgi:hypothetical protein